MGGEWLLGFVLLICLAPQRASAASQKALDLQRFRSTYPDLTDFLKLLHESPSMSATLTWKNGTLFVPTNSAVQTYNMFHRDKPITNSILLYHYANVRKYQNELEAEDSITSDLPANLPIWIAKKNRELYLNNAQILNGNLKLQWANCEQIVHVIDRVLEPTLPTVDEPHLDSPNARKYLENSGKYGLAANELTIKFANHVRKISTNDNTGLLESIGKRTFFIPVDDAFKNNNNIRAFDERTIDGHIIPDRAVFLRTAEIGQRVGTYKTTDFAANFPVFISFGKETIDGKEVWTVKSDNREGDKDHLKGVVQAKIIKANIPVKNGVIHLISKPLVIIDTSVFQTLKLYGTEQIGSMREFYNLLNSRNVIFNFRRILEGTGPDTHKITLFVPSNKAIRTSTELNNLRDNSTALEELIKLHILAEPVPAEKIIEKSRHLTKKPYQVASLLTDRKLFFNVIGAEGNRTLFVEGGGVNATIAQADFGATNGFIHIIDKVLGIPNHSFEEKLRTHPLLETTYHLWVNERFDEKLNNSLEPFTFFAPSNEAWRNLRFKSEAAYSNIIERSLGAMPTQLLERHLLLRQDYTIEKLSEISRNHISFTVPTANNTNSTNVKINYPLVSVNAYLRVVENITVNPKHAQHEGHKKEEVHYYVQWKDMIAHVVRPNVKCTNGIIHIIDTVLMDNKEITVAAASRPRNTFWAEMVILAFALCFIN